MDFKYKRVSRTLTIHDIYCYFTIMGYFVCIYEVPQGPAGSTTASETFPSLLASDFFFRLLEHPSKVSLTARVALLSYSRGRLLPKPPSQPKGNLSFYLPPTHTHTPPLTAFLYSTGTIPRHFMGFCLMLGLSLECTRPWTSTPAVPRAPSPF